METYRRILYEPKMKPMVKPTPVPIMAPILTLLQPTVFAFRLNIRNSLHYINEFSIFEKRAGKM